MTIKSKFATTKISERIKIIKDQKTGFQLLEEDQYNAVVVGLAYTEDVESEFEGVKKVQDKVTYMLAVEHEDKFVPLRVEYTVSNFEQAVLPKILDKFGITDIAEFYKLFGETIRVSVAVKTSKKGKQYNYIDKMIPAKKTQDDLEVGTLVLPYFYAEGIGEFELLDGVTFGEKKEDSPKRTKIESSNKSDVDDVEESEEVLEDGTDDEDEFFDDLED